MLTVKRLYQQLKNIYHYCQAQAWRMYYRWPDRDMKIYGVTGTNGKTTTSLLLGTVLREAYGKERVGLMTTIVFWVGSEEKVNESKMTTMPSREVFKLLAQMRRVGVGQVVMEVTSHALDQHRLAGIKLSGAIILNIAREHLDYHGTMESYAAAKLKIVGLIKEGGVLLVNEKLTMGDGRWANKSKLAIIKFSKEQAGDVVTPLRGEVNKENVLAASLLARAMGINEEAIETAVMKVDHVPGRMEWVLPKFPISNFQFSNNMLPRVLIDYAVTPDALERLYGEVRTETKGKIWAVLGACGNRDRGKRPDMARVVAKYADELVLTREDPWTEDEEQIFGDLEKGVRDSETVWQRIVDRRQAIRYCIDRASLDDVVVVTGKGAETGMAVGKEIIPWSDKQVIQELLSRRQG